MNKRATRQMSLNPRRGSMFDVTAIDVPAGTAKSLAINFDEPMLVWIYSEVCSCIRVEVPPDLFWEAAKSICRRHGGGANACQLVIKRLLCASPGKPAALKVAHVQHPCACAWSAHARAHIHAGPHTHCAQFVSLHKKSVSTAYGYMRSMT